MEATATISATRRDAVEKALWSGGPAKPVWAVLDLARSARVRQLLLTTKLESLSLYAGAPRELDRVAPHIVEMLPGHALLHQLVDEGWGQSWGVFVRLDDPTVLRHHLRKLLKVRDERGRSLLFRFYDPRVLRAYLPTCTVPELELMFGPVSHWLCESAGGDALVEFGRERSGALRQRSLAVTA